MTQKKKRKGTKTRSFGSSKRESHDSSDFYDRKLFDDIPAQSNDPYVENKVPSKYINKIICSSSEVMKELPDNSIHLMITSPPYCSGKVYDLDLTLDAYSSFLNSIWKEIHRVLIPGGRACVNAANLGRKPYIPLHSIIINSYLNIGFLMRGEIIWDKSASAGSSTAWGSWQSASNPVLRDVHEYILIFSKASFKRKKNKTKTDTITKEEFLENTKSIWQFPTVSAKKIGHPAPYPLELPRRLIQLYSFKGDVVLDPFMGSGQTAIAAVEAHRNFVGYELKDEYVALAEKRINEFRNSKMDSPN
jgi:site-specific DNA-methyltransferase (adenine-specific)